MVNPTTRKQNARTSPQQTVVDTNAANANLIWHLLVQTNDRPPPAVMVWNNVAP